MQEENQFFIGVVGIAAVDVQPGDEAGQASSQVGPDRVQGLGKFGSFGGGIERSFDELVIRQG